MRRTIHIMEHMSPPSVLPDPADDLVAGDASGHESVATPALGEVVVVIIDGVDVAIANTGGVIRAFDDACTHRECPLSEGTIDAISVTCPCHKSRFDLETGAPLNGPATVPIRIRSVRPVGDRLLVER